MAILLKLFILFAVTYPVLGNKFYKINNLSGIGLVLLISIPAWYIGQKIPVVGGPIFGILFGLLLSFWKYPESLNNGIKITSKKVLQAAIVLFGFNMNLMHVLEVGSQSIVIMLATIFASLLTAFIVSKMLKIDTTIATLVGVGTSICGGSAIAAVAPVVKAHDKQVAAAISTIFIYNVIAVFLFPFLGSKLGMSDVGFGIWAGTAINDTSSVVAAAYSFSDSAGNVATVVKLTRTLMIIPISFILAIYTSKKAKSTDNSFSIVRIFPWFVLGFIASCFINTLGIIPVYIVEFLGSTGKFFIVMAMSAIGLNTNIKDLITNGRVSILLGGVCWIIVSITSLIMQYILALV